jgi:tRNA pseudouridine32 synthase/23S rRNA pseudouridine746 synthase
MLLHARSLVVPREGKPAISAVAPLPASFAGAGFTETAGAQA